MKKIYFHLLDSFIGQTYFRVSKHLSIPISEVISRFYSHDLDIIMLMRMYGEELKRESENAKRIKKQAKQSKFKKRRMRR